MERRNKPKATNANKEHKQSLPTRENGVIAAIRGYVLHKTQTMGQGPHHQQGNGDQCCQTREKNGRSVISWTDEPVRPESQTCHVSNNGERSAAVGGDDDDRTVNHSLLIVCNHCMHNAKHEADRRQVVKICGKHERERR